MLDTKSSGIGVGGLLLVAFIILKLCHIINWSWWWVLAPVWIPFGIVLICAIIIGLAYLIKDMSK